MIDFQQVLQEYQGKGHIPKQKLSIKPESVVYLMQNPEVKSYVLRICDKRIEAYEAITGHFCPNLPQVFKASEMEGLFIVEEEYIDGITLWEMISGGTRMDEERAVRISLQICSGLDFLHQKGLVHRDIKPENVMLTPEGKIYIIDLDASMRLNRYKENDTTLLGTAMYAAPEQFGLTRSDERTDIYALGILINELLTGVHPAVETYRKGFLGNVIETCTRMNPADRYQSVDELQCALLSAVPTGGTASGDIPVLQPQPGKKPRPNKRKYLPAVLFMVFSVAAGAGTLKGFLDGDFAEENPSDVIPVSTQTEYDKAVVHIVKWDAEYNGWMLSAEHCKVGAEGYIHAEKDGKHYAILVKVVGRPLSAYASVPDIYDVGNGYLAESYNQEILRENIIPMKYEKGKPVTIYLTAPPHYDVINPACDNPLVSIKKIHG